MKSDNLYQSGEIEKVLLGRGISPRTVKEYLKRNSHKKLFSEDDIADAWRIDDQVEDRCCGGFDGYRFVSGCPELTRAERMRKEEDYE